MKKSLLVFGFALLSLKAFAVQIEIGRWSTTLSNVECFRETSKAHSDFLRIFIGRHERDTQERVEILVPDLSALKTAQQNGELTQTRKLEGGRSGTVDLVTFDQNRNPKHMTFGLPRSSKRGECKADITFADANSEALSISIQCNGVPRKLVESSSEVLDYRIPKVECPALTPLAKN